MLEKVSLDRLALVHPKLSALVNQMDGILGPQGIHLRVVQGLRTNEQQADLYAQGRSKAGEVVTDAPPGHSWHNYGTAVDLIPGLRNQTQWEPNWSPQSQDFSTMIQCGVSLGLVSGSRWNAIKDYPHFQMAGLPVSPNQEMCEFLLAHGVQAFWSQFLD